MTRRAKFLVVFVIALLVAGTGTAYAFWSASATGNANASASSLNAPTAGSAAANSATQITISWTNPGTQLPGAQYRVTHSGDSLNGTVACTTSSNSCVDTNTLSGSTPYSYSIVAFLSNWVSAATTASATTPSADSTPPTTASVTTPADGSVFRAATVPSTFSGSAADNAGGLGLSANSTTFTLKRSTDNNFWNGSTWQASAFNLATTHTATTSNTSVGWTNSATLPTWSAQPDAVYTVQATATDANGNSFTGSANAFTLDKTNPTSALVTSPSTGAVFRAATVPATFTGSAADNAGGAGLAANSTTFTLQRPDNTYWNGSTWQAGVFNLATTNAATTGSAASPWTSNVTMPAWASQPDGTYTVTTTATDKAGNPFTGSSITFTLDKTNPITASVTAPASGSIFRAATAPSSFGGSAADNLNGSGLAANSTTFTLQRSSDNNFWNGSTWQISALALSTTHSATTSNTAAIWTSNVTMPAWASTTDGTYTVTATATDKAGNTFTGAAITFTLDNTKPVTATVTAPANGATLKASSVPATFSGSAADNAGGVGLAANTATFTLQRPDNTYWTGSAWQAGVFNLATTHSATSSGTAATWTSNVTMPTWSGQPNGVYTVKATATDKAGNAFTGSAITFTLDNTAPTGSITAPAAGTIGGTVAVTSSDAADTGGSGLASVQFQEKPTAGSFTTIGTVNAPGPYTVNWDTTGVANGTYVLQAIITDGAGNTTTTAQVNVTVNNTFTVTAATPQTAGTAFNVTITAKANGVTNTNYTGSHAMSFSGPATSPNGTAPTYPANVTFTNGVGTASVTLTKAETTTITATSGNLSGTSGSVVVNAAPASVIVLSNCNLNGSSVACAASFNLGNSPGNVKANVSVTDAFGNTPAATTVSFTITSANGNYTVTGSSVSITSGTTSSTQFTVTHANNASNSAVITVHATSGSYTDLTFTVNK